MKRLYFLFLMAFMALTANASTTLWEGVCTASGVCLNEEVIQKFNAGDVLRIYATIPDEGANFNIVYKNPSDWSEHTIPSIGTGWPWLNGGDPYKDFTLTNEDITSLNQMQIYIYNGEKSVINRVSLIGNSTGQKELLDGNWTADWTGKTFAAQSDAKKGDIIRFTLTSPGSWGYSQFNILDGSGNANAFVNNVTNYGKSFETETEVVFEFEITNASDLEKIQNEGFGIKGDKFTLTSVKLLTYADSYDAVAVTIGSDGIATFSSSKKLDFSGTGVTPYYASAVAIGTVTLTATSTTWDYCGYILQGPKGTYDVPVTASASYPAATYLKGQTSEGTVAASTEGKYHYIFAKNGSDIGFYKLTADHTLAAHKAYLETTENITPSSNSGARLVLNFDDDPTAVTEIKSEAKEVEQDGVYYNLNGQRVEKPTKGIYIKNGKKVLF